MKTLDTRELAHKLNVSGTAVSVELPLVLEWLGETHPNSRYLYNEEQGVVFLPDQADLDYVNSGMGKLCFMDLVTHFNLPKKDVTWILTQLLNKGIIPKELGDYYNQVKNQPSVKAWFEPKKIALGGTTILNVQLNCLESIVEPKLAVEAVECLKLEEQPELPHKIYPGVFNVKYLCKATAHAAAKVGVVLEGTVEEKKVHSETNPPADLIIMPLSPQVTVSDGPRRYNANYRESFTLVLKVVNNGKGAAQNVEVGGFDRHRDCEVIDAAKIDKIDSRGSANITINLKPKRSGAYYFDDLFLHYEDSVGTGFSSAVPKLALNVVNPPPRLKVELKAPEVVEPKQVFILSIKLSNVGEGDARNLQFALPLEQHVAGAAGDRAHQQEGHGDQQPPSRFKQFCCPGNQLTVLKHMLNDVCHHDQIEGFFFEGT